MDCIVDNVIESMVNFFGMTRYCGYVGEYPCFCRKYKLKYSGVKYDLCNLLSNGLVRKYINIPKYIDILRERK